MNRVWITRTEPGASRFARYLRMHSISCSISPLIEIQQTPVQLPKVSVDLAVYLSQHAVRCAPLDQLCAKRSFAIGEATRRTLAERAIASEIPRLASSEGLLANIQSALQPGASIAVLCGEGGRDFLPRRLRNLGFTVMECCVYRRRVTRCLPHVAKLCDAIELSSISAFDAYHRLCETSQSFNAERKTLVVPSHRIASHVLKFGDDHVIEAKDATPRSFARTLTRLNAHA
ncbi:MAG: uroporphyrinogen-III synthase [Gammaproteobacteria bacterium]|nr:uroporphyrinogen-III synthase [Gammaproteobacteria bacterium]